MTTHFFLGANSGSGFQSLYGQLMDPERTRDMLVLKGGPGVGKSSFMRQIGQAAEERKLAVEYICCSGDPASLDAVLLPQLGVIAVDGTAPHVVEPEYPVAVDRYVDLGRFYDVDALKHRRDEILQNCRAYRRAYAEAYGSLRAAEGIRREVRQRVAGVMDQEKLQRRFQGIIRREIPSRKNGKKGCCQCRFLGGVTHLGEIFCWESVWTLCPRIYELADHYGLSWQVLENVREEACAAGWDVIACMDPEQPQRILHLLIPGRELAFLSADASQHGKQSYRRIRVEAMAEPEFFRKNKSYLRFARRVEETMKQDAVEHLRQAKHWHDQLEAVYNPCVDFDGVYRLAQKEICRMLP